MLEKLFGGHFTLEERERGFIPSNLWFLWRHAKLPIAPRTSFSPLTLRNFLILSCFTVLFVYVSACCCRVKSSNKNTRLLFSSGGQKVSISHLMDRNPVLLQTLHFYSLHRDPGCTALHCTYFRVLLWFLKVLFLHFHFFNSCAASESLRCCEAPPHLRP